MISATPKPGAQPKHGDAKPLLKVQAKVWIDKAEYQWVRLEAETTATISFGLFIARLESRREADLRADARERRSVAAQARGGAAARRGWDW